MDAFAVQQHVADWLNNSGVPGLDRVWPAIPNVDGINFALYGSGESRCQGVVYMEADTDVRRSLGAPDPSQNKPASGMRWITYQVRIEVVHLWTNPDWIAGDRVFKGQIVQGITNAIRLDPSLGTATIGDPLFKSAGEGRMGIRRQYEPPASSEEGREQWAYVSFQTNAWVTG